jgi:uncharacterized membrane protein YqjE
MAERAAGASAYRASHDDEEQTGIIRGLIGTLIDAIRTRLDLASVEVEMYLLRTLQMLLWSVAAVACAVLALVFGLVCLIVALWDTHRLMGLLAGTLLFVALSVLCGAIGLRVFRNRRHLLEGTLQQLDHDQRQVGGGAR